jgi:hypothetical protein
VNNFIEPNVVVTKSQVVTHANCKTEAQRSNANGYANISMMNHLGSLQGGVRSTLHNLSTVMAIALNAKKMIAPAMTMNIDNATVVQWLYQNS